MPFKPSALAKLPPAAWAPFAAFLYFLLRYHSLGYSAGGGLVLAGFLLAWRNWPRVEGSPLGLLLLLAASLALPALGLWQFLQLQDLGDLDHASYSQALWNLRHGSLDFTFHDRNMFGIHSQYTSVLWIPVHWAAGETGLKLGKAFCLLAAVWLVLRRLRGNPAAP